MDLRSGSKKKERGSFCFYTDANDPNQQLESISKSILQGKWSLRQISISHLLITRCFDFFLAELIIYLCICLHSHSRWPGLETLKSSNGAARYVAPSNLWRHVDLHRAH